MMHEGGTGRFGHSERLIDHHAKSTHDLVLKVIGQRSRTTDDMFDTADIIVGDLGSFDHHDQDWWDCL